MKEKLKKVISIMNQNLIEREEIVKLSLLTLLAQENLLLFGKPGTAKSAISRRLSEVISGGVYFEYLLTKFTTPEELFGPLSIKELKKDKFQRKIDGYMPKADVVFLDEIFKSNSAILNSLLSIINEKVFHNGNERLEVPLKSLIGASNELPFEEDEEDLSALYDRFLLRLKVSKISDENIEKIFKITDKQFVIPEKLKLSDKDIDDIKKNYDDVIIPDKIISLIIEIRKKYTGEYNDNQKELLSDRKLIKIIKLLKISALTNDRTEVNESDLYLLRNCLWNDDKNIDTVNTIVNNVIGSKYNNVGNTALLEFSDDKKDKTSTNIKLSGDGSIDNPFLIQNELDLFSLSNPDISYQGYYFKQTNDIDLNNFKNWGPISRFEGHYDGQFNKIMNLNINDNDKIMEIGLFRSIGEDSSVFNIILDNINIDIECNSKDFAYFGGLIGENYGTIKNCFVIGTLSSKVYSGMDLYVGGIAGKNEGIIVQCYTNCDIQSNERKYSNTGGIAGKNDNKILNCHSTGNINSIVSVGYGIYSNAGGIVGENNGTIEKCYSTCTVESNKYSGGIVGHNAKNISDCISINEEINGEEGSSRISAKKDNNSKQRNNYALETILVNGEEINSNDTYGVDGKGIPESLLSQSYFENTLNWDFADIWTWDIKENRPVLNFEKRRQNKNGCFNSDVIVEDDLILQINNNIWLLDVGNIHD